MIYIKTQYKKLKIILDKWLEGVNTDQDDYIINNVKELLANLRDIV